MSETITYDNFEKVDIRVGEITDVQPFPRARKPSYKIRVNFGDEFGTRWSSAQLTNYTPDELMGRQVLAVVNFAPRNIVGFMSECLILGAPMAGGTVSLLSPTRPAVLGGKVF